MPNLYKVMALVDLVGIEPTTSSMPWKRAPNCATGPQKGNSSIVVTYGWQVKHKITELWVEKNGTKPPAIRLSGTAAER